jgi:trans-aconitate methyltransferase
VKIEEYISTLPPSIISGQDVELGRKSLREIFDFAGLGRSDVFYHLGCGTGSSLAIAEKEFGVKKAVGVDNDAKKTDAAMELVKSENLSCTHLKCEDAAMTDLSDATFVLFWFSDFDMAESVMRRVSVLQGCKVVTVLDPLPKTLPTKVSFPYILHTTPFREAALKEQLMAIYDTECIDFTTAWEYAERYTKAVGAPDAGNDRFLTILQAVTIWINAKRLGLSCTDEMPPAIKTYVGILRNFFGIEVTHLLDK